MSDLAERICTECPARAANNCPYANFPHLKRKCEYRSDVMYGYELAEKDLALTWEDMKTIFQIIATSDWYDFEINGKLWSQEFYEEVLKRYLEAKK